MKPLITIILVASLACSTSHYAGQSFESAIVVQYTTKQEAETFELQTIAERYPNYKVIGKKQERRSDKFYDLFTLRTETSQQVIIFDITKYCKEL